MHTQIEMNMCSGSWHAKLKQQEIKDRQVAEVARHWNVLMRIVHTTINNRMLFLFIFFPTSIKYILCTKGVNSYHNAAP